MTTLKGKTALITGSGRGLGAAIAIRFAELGANIIVNYSKDNEAADKTVELIKQLGVNVTSIKADVSKVFEY